MWKRYLMWFAQEHVEFRFAEMLSIVSMYNISIKFIEKPCIEKPYWIVELPSEDIAKQLASRSVALKSCIELWSKASSIPQLHKNMQNSLQMNKQTWFSPTNSADIDNHVCPKILIDTHSSSEKSFKVEVETFCKHYSLEEKVKKIEMFHYLPFEGPVKLKNPDVKLNYIEFYGMDPNNIPELPYNVFFGRWIADGQRDLIQKHSLKKRSFIGNTSMDPQLSIFTANQAQVRAGDIVLDPFVGSGSLLIAAAHFGGYVWGSDIDFMMLHGRTRPTRVGQKVRTKDESVYANMNQYGTKSTYLDVVVSDFSLPLWRDGMQLDAIITDPPYGIREPIEKIGIEKDNYILSEEHLVNHIPAKVDYGLPHLYGDLLSFAAKYLRIGRRLVCWYPVVRDEYDEASLPSHPCLRLVANSEQVLSKLTARRLLTYEKIKENELNDTSETKETPNFREIYFAVGEISRRERKEIRQREIENTNRYKNNKI